MNDRPDFQKTRVLRLNVQYLHGKTRHIGLKKKSLVIDQARKAPLKEETESVWTCVQTSGAKETFLP